MSGHIEVSRAIELAARYHRNQVDKGGEPYILHPLRVMTAVRQAHFSAKHQVIAVLHDIVEDTDIRLTDLTWLGKELCQSLIAITRRYQAHPSGKICFDEYGALAHGDPQETHQEYFQRCVQDPIARVVKYYDTVDNMDPRRFRPGVPLGRYVKAITWFHDNGVVAPPTQPL